MLFTRDSMAGERQLRLWTPVLPRRVDRKQSVQKIAKNMVGGPGKWPEHKTQQDTPGRTTPVSCQPFAASERPMLAPPFFGGNK